MWSGGKYTSELEESSLEILAVLDSYFDGMMATLGPIMKSFEGMMGAGTFGGLS